MEDLHFSCVKRVYDEPFAVGDDDDGSFTVTFRSRSSLQTSLEHLRALELRLCDG